MATFFYDRHSGENNLTQWTKHLQTEEYINDIGQIVSYNRRELEKTIQSATAEQTRVFNSVFGSLENVNRNLQEINSNIYELRSEISSMAAMLDWRLSLMIEEQRLTNQLLGHIAELLRIPDSQKQRVYHIEQGLKYLKNAILEDINSSFYIDAFDGFKEAEKIEPKDYITLNRIGQIYLYSKKYMDFSLAETYFVKSAREAFVESNAGGTTTSNHLNPLGKQNNHNHFRVATVESYLYAGRACYLQQKLNEAIEFAGKAFKLMPEFADAGFDQAKYFAANNQENEAVKVLKIVIETDRYFSVKAFLDKDLNDKRPILNLLEDFRIKAISTAKKDYTECLNIALPNSKASSILNEIETEISQNTFLSAMNAIDILNREYDLPITAYYEGPYQDRVWKNVTNTPKKIKEFLIAESNEGKNLQDVQNGIVKYQSNDGAIMTGLGGGVIGLVVGFFTGGILLAIVIGAGIGAGIGFLRGQLTNTSIRD